MIIIPRWIARLPWVRSRIFYPKITLRAHPEKHVVRYGVMPDGIEADLGDTVFCSLAKSRETYLFKLWTGLHGLEPKFAAPIQVEGTDFYPLPSLDLDLNKHARTQRTLGPDSPGTTADA